MTALSKAKKTQKLQSSGVLAERFNFPLAADAVIWGGAVVALNQSGYLVPASADASLFVCGVACESVDNTGGSAGDLYCTVLKGAFEAVNSSSTDALTAADVGRPCYVVDDQTVARTSAGGARPYAGTVAHVESSSEIYVEFGCPSADSRNIDMLIAAGETLTSDLGKSVKVHSDGTAIKSGAGEPSMGVLQNAPASGAIAIVRVAGVTRGKADATGVTRGNYISSGAAGVLRASTDAATGLGHVNTSDGGSSTDALRGGYVLGIALETAAANATFGLLLTHSGVCAVTAV